MSDYDSVLQKVIDHMLDTIIEALAPPKDIPIMKDDIAHPKIDIATIKAVATSQSSRYNNHEVRITNLEATS